MWDGPCQLYRFPVIVGGRVIKEKRGRERRNGDGGEPKGRGRRVGYFLLNPFVSGVSSVCRLSELPWHQHSRSD